VPFTLALIAIAVAIFAFGRWLDSSYAFFIGYVVVQYIVLGTAWNILGGYTGYVNFGITAFFAIGAYSTVALHKLVPTLPLPAMIVVSGVLAGLVGLGTARRVLLDRDLGAGGRGADPDHQLGLCRRRARRLCAAAEGGAADRRRVRAIPVSAHAGHVRHRAGDGARH